MLRASGGGGRLPNYPASRCAQHTTCSNAYVIEYEMSTFVCECVCAYAFMLRGCVYCYRIACRRSVAD